MGIPLLSSPHGSTAVSIAAGAVLLPCTRALQQRVLLDETAAQV